MNLSWPAWVLVICVVAALVCMGYGAIRALRAMGVVKNHVNRLKSLPLLAEVSKAQANVQRINTNLAAMDELLVRANVAIRTINDGIKDLRIPEAIAAVRTAGIAIRLLLNHH